jgi:hypothetical protein
MGTPVEIRDFNKSAAIAFVGWVKEVSAAIVTAEADSVDYRLVLFVAERPSYQVLGFRFLENLIYLRTGDFRDREHPPRPSRQPQLDTQNRL